MEIKGKVALVTGASRGIGRAIALALAEQGADVAVTARTLSPRAALPGSLEETMADLAVHGGDAKAFAADLSDMEQVLKLGDDVVAWKGRIDILINNAAFLARPTYQTVDELSVKNFMKQINVNLAAPYALIKAALPSMRAVNEGVICNITSGGQSSNPMDDYEEGILPGLVYGTSKLALNRMSFDIARDLRGSGIAIFSVGPGFVHSGTADIAAESTGLDLSDALPPETPARGVVDLIGRAAEDVSCRVWNIVAEGSPVLRHDGHARRTSLVH